MEFLLEIMTEEMPSSHVKLALEQLSNLFEEELEKERIKANELRTLGTCRRLVVLADLPARQKDREEIIIGPPKKVAYSEDGRPTQAVLGFAKTNNVSVEELQIFNTPKGEYVGLKKKLEGRLSQNLLPEIIPRVVGRLTFPKMMRWGEATGRFSRPVKNILALFTGQPLELACFDWPIRPKTFGHRLHAPGPLTVSCWQEYLKALENHYVIIEPQERRRRILTQAEKLLSPLKAELYPDAELLEKLVFDVEHPLVIKGSFPEKYLILPIEIISTALREGQKLFSVVRQGKQVPLFIGVADQIADPQGVIKRGYERVLKARLEDALFFWEHDLKVSLKDRVPQLARVIFQERLGTYLEKTERLKKLVSFLAQHLGEKANLKNLVLAAELAKADLLTEMVREFPSLQGKVGGLYCQAQKLPMAISRAIYEHYQPVSLEDASPSSLGGALLALADKLDSLVGALGIGAEISGSSDPLGLRRYAHGVCKIILDHKLRLPFLSLVKKSILLYQDKLTLSPKEALNSCLNFISQRLRYIYERFGFRYDLINASLGVGIEDIYLSFLRLKALDALQSHPEFEPLVLMVRRVNNILRGQPAFRLNPTLLKEKAEKELYSTFKIIKENATPLIKESEFLRAQKMVFKLEVPLNQFFDKVLVMAEDKKIRQNRLALLNEIRTFLLSIADFSAIVLEGDKENRRAAAKQ